MCESLTFFMFDYPTLPSEEERNYDAVPSLRFRMEMCREVYKESILSEFEILKKKLLDITKD